MVESDFKQLDMGTVNEFLEQQVPVDELETVVTCLSSVCPTAELASSSTVRRHVMLRDYRYHCNILSLPPDSLPAMQTVIFLSQLLARPGAQASDMEWILLKVGRIGKKQSKEDGILWDFFRSVGFPLVEVQHRKEGEQIGKTTIGNNTLTMNIEGNMKEEEE